MGVGSGDGDGTVTVVAVRRRRGGGGEWDSGGASVWASADAGPIIGVQVARKIAAQKTVAEEGVLEVGGTWPRLQGCEVTQLACKTWPAKCQVS